MKHRKLVAIFTVFSLLAGITACSPSVPQAEAVQGEAAAHTVEADLSDSSGQIYLYGEAHSVEKIIEKELALWNEYYHEKNMRHLFIEMPYYTAEYLNIWIKSDSDELLDKVYNEWEGSLSYNPLVKDFYKKIKMDCPETVFHGTDVGHQYKTTGEQYLKYLESNGKKDSEQYVLAQEAIEQGKYYYDNEAEAYRENKMAENFIREYNKLNGENIMGIYGGAHVGLEDNDIGTHSVPSMANQLKAQYGDAVHSENLAWIAKDIEPSRTDKITVNGKEYVAQYFDKYDISWSEIYTHREFWHLEDAYHDFKDNRKSGDMLPYDNYPMLIEKGEVFVIDYTKTDGSVERKYYRSDGNEWEGMPSTEEFIVVE